MLTDFIEKVENKTPYLGAPPAGTPMLKDFYITIENAVTNTIQELNTSDHTKKALAIIDFLKDCAYCGGKIYSLSIEVFNRVVKKIPPSYENSVYGSLADLRSIDFQSVVPPGKQSVHASTHLLKAFGKKYGIPGGEEMGRFDDVYAERDSTLGKKKKNF